MKDSNFYELLGKLASNLTEMQKMIKEMQDSSQELSKEEFLKIFNKSLDEISNITYNKLINTIYSDPKFQELILSLIKLHIDKMTS